jgi:4-hydroxy-tetrahydrodipicolinate reductase
MLSIALVGYGKMGKAVEKEALGRGHQIVARVDRNEEAKLTALSPSEVDAIIEFTHPDSFWGNMETLLPTGIPLVTGTTGWYDDKARLEKLVIQHQASLMYAANFSVGVNILFKLNRDLARLMNRYPEYDPYIEEQHHRFKADAPSGTAIALAEGLMEELDRKTTVSNEELRSRPPGPEELSVGYTRAGGIIGKHRVSYFSEIDQVTIMHEAYNRRGFALGAVIAAEYIQGKDGMRNFQELFE